MPKTIERYGIGLVVGAVVTVGLLWIMQAVIASDKNPLNEETNLRKLDFVRLMEDVPPEIQRKRLQPPPPPDEPPPDLPEVDNSNDDGGYDTNINIDIGGADGIGEFDVGDWSQDGEYLPISKVAPIYPSRALQRGIEGYVIVVFTVTETGSVEDVKVREADPPGIFDRAAINAAYKFKYKPKVVNEKAVRVEGVPNKIIFELDDY